MGSDTRHLGRHLRQNKPYFIETETEIPKPVNQSIFISVTLHDILNIMSNILNMSYTGQYWYFIESEF